MRNTQVEWTRASLFCSGHSHAVTHLQTSNASCGYKCPALEQWYSAARDDHFLVGEATHRGQAVSANYVLQRIEGYQANQDLPPPPPPPGWAPWPDATPASSPFPKSKDITGFEFYSGNNYQCVQYHRACLQEAFVEVVVCVCSVVVVHVMVWGGGLLKLASNPVVASL